ncbi:MAG: ABC transporter permease subunit [Chloroflexota bacterium]
MIDPLLRKALSDLRTQVLGWGLGIGALLFLTVALYPSISSAYGDVWKQLPQEWRYFFGLEFSLDTLEGYLSAEFFSYAPLVLAVFAILVGTDALAGEEGRGTLDLLLAQPVSRTRLAFMKLLGLAIANGAVIAIILALLWIATLSVNVEMHAGRVLTAFVLLWPFETAVAFLSVLLSLAFPGRLLAGTVMAVLLVASYILEALANMVSGLETLRPLFLTVYYQGTRALVSEVSWAYVGGLVGIVVVAFVLILVLFQQRDIGVRSGLRLPRLPLRRTDVPRN